MRKLLIGLLLLVLLPWHTAQAAEERCFPETGFCISGRFLEYWQANGGLAVFGYPISAATPELNRDTGQEYLTQWFERARFELHTDLAQPYDVLLGRIGDDVLLQNGIRWQDLPAAAGPQAGCLWFEQTRHNVCNQQGDLGFKHYWENHGLNDPLLDNYGRSLQLFGLPLSEPRMETNESGDTVLTQWFERARFEWHPNKPDEFKVLLGLLGTEIAAYGPIGDSSYPENVTTFKHGVLFTADDGTHGRELWFSDGTTAGTRLIKDIFPGPEFSTPIEFVVLGEIALFSARDNAHETELWRTDGTPEGTWMVHDINVGAGGSYPFQLTKVGAQVFFAADDGVHGYEIWRTDGTSAGTRMVADLASGNAPSWPQNAAPFAIPFQFTAYNGWVYFMANDGTHGDEIWRSDGNSMQQVTEIAPSNETSIILSIEATDTLGIYFTAWDQNNGYGLWRTFGDYKREALLQTYPSNTNAFRPYPPVGELHGLGNTMYLAIEDLQAQSFYLWQIDEGQIQKHYTIAHPRNIMAVDKSLYFISMGDSEHGGLYRITANGPQHISPAAANSLIMGAYRDGVILMEPKTVAPDNSQSYTLQIYIPNVTYGIDDLKTFLGGIAYSGPYAAANGNTIFVSVATNRYGIELWTWDNGQTKLTRDIKP